MKKNNDTRKNERMKEQDKILHKAYNEGFLSGFDFSVLMHNLLVSENGYVLDTGNYEDVNAEVALRLAKNIEQHPILWKLFFMVA